MKIIDNHGRLFGKLNLVDLLVILLVIAVGVAVVLKVTHKNADELSDFSDRDGNTLEYTVLCRMVSREMLPDLELEVGNQLMSNGKMVEDCRVLSVEEEPYTAQVALADGTVVTVEDPDFCNVTFTIGGTAPYAECAYHVGSQEVRVGKAHIVKTLTAEVNGTVTALTGAAFDAEAAHD